MEEQKIKLLKSDILAAAVIGILAFLFSLLVIKNLKLKIPYFWSALFFIPLCLVGIYIGYLLGQKKKVIFQFAKFGETGGLNLLVDFGILNLLILLTGISTGILYSVFKGISFTSAVINSYIWNKFWVFKKRGKSEEVRKEIINFVIVSVVGLGINVLLASLLVYFSSLGHPQLQWQKIWANAGAALGSITAMMWNFIGYKFFVFKK